jgi:hypothetical protein
MYGPAVLKCLGNECYKCLLALTYNTVIVTHQNLRQTYSFNIIYKMPHSLALIIIIIIIIIIAVLRFESELHAY